MREFKIKLEASPAAKCAPQTTRPHSRRNWRNNLKARSEIHRQPGNHEVTPPRKRTLSHPTFFSPFQSFTPCIAPTLRRRQSPKPLNLILLSTDKNHSDFTTITMSAVVDSSPSPHTPPQNAKRPKGESPNPRAAPKTRISHAASVRPQLVQSAKMRSSSAHCYTACSTRVLSSSCAARLHQLTMTPHANQASSRTRTSARRRPRPSPRHRRC